MVKKIVVVGMVLFIPEFITELKFLVRNFGQKIYFWRAKKFPRFFLDFTLGTLQSVSHYPIGAMGAAAPGLCVRMHCTGR